MPNELGSSNNSGDLERVGDMAPKSDSETSRDDQAGKRQRMRSIAIAWALVLLVVLFYLATVIRMGGNVLNRSL